MGSTSQDAKGVANQNADDLETVEKTYECFKCGEPTNKVDQDGWHVCLNPDCEQEEFSYV